MLGGGLLFATLVYFAARALKSGRLHRVIEGEESLDPSGV